jgi:SAM-dependent methyltransferase
MTTGLNDITSAGTKGSVPLPQVSHQRAVTWVQDGQTKEARWRCERQAPPPQRVQVGDDRLPADTAFRLACEGTAFLWNGDFQNARHLLAALTRRLDSPPRAKRRSKTQGDACNQSAPTPPGHAFHKHRMAQAQRARVLSQVLIPMNADYSIPLRRAPDFRQACLEAWGEPQGDASVVSLRELLGVVSAHEWRKKGVAVSALGAADRNRIHPHYGVFSPVRGEYIDLVLKAPLPTGSLSLALDVGTGSGVLAAVLARRGVRRVLATDQDARALACAQDNVNRLGVAEQVMVVKADLFPPEPGTCAALVVCNPPWLPARPTSPIERAVYDEDSRMLKGFLTGLKPRLLPGGEGWLLLSDLAEHLGLRSRDELLQWIDDAGLEVLGRLDTRPRHHKAGDSGDPLHGARSAEITSLWRLGVKQ